MAAFATSIGLALPETAAAGEAEPWGARVAIESGLGLLGGVVGVAIGAVGYVGSLSGGCGRSDSAFDALSVAGASRLALTPISSVGPAGFSVGLAGRL